MGAFSSYLPYLFAVLVFAAVVLLVEGAYVWWSDVRGPEARRVERRLQMMSAGAHDDKSTSVLKQRLLAASPSLEKLLLRLPRVHGLDRLLEQSGLPWSVAQYLVLTFALVLGAVLAATMLTKSVMVLVLVGLGVALLPLGFVFRARHRRMVRIELQMPDALDLMSRALRAGHAFP